MSAGPSHVSDVASDSPDTQRKFFVREAAARCLRVRPTPEGDFYAVFPQKTNAKPLKRSVRSRPGRSLVRAAIARCRWRFDRQRECAPQRAPFGPAPPRDRLLGSAWAAALALTGPAAVAKGAATASAAVTAAASSSASAAAAAAAGALALDEPRGPVVAAPVQRRSRGGGGGGGGG